MSIAFPLADLLERMRREGFTIGVDDHLKLVRLASFDTSWTRDKLHEALRCIFAKDLESREAFDRIFIPFFSQVEPVTAGLTSEEPYEPGLRKARPLRLRNVIFAGVLVSIVVLAIAIPWVLHQSPTESPIQIDEPPAVEVQQDVDEDVVGEEDVESEATSICRDHTDRIRAVSGSF